MVLDIVRVRGAFISFAAGALAATLITTQISNPINNLRFPDALPNFNTVKGPDDNGGDQPWSLAGLWYRNISRSSAKPTDPLIMILRVDLDKATPAEQDLYTRSSIFNGTLRDARWEPQLVFMTASQVPGENKIYWAEMYTNGELGLRQHERKYQVFACSHPAISSVEFYGTLSPAFQKRLDDKPECKRKINVYPPEFGLQRYVDESVWRVSS
mmetsp:Transcript_27618/g.70362  ORF Transcript_27618/g.70362 Transcript_27618/m.70362 type:complete len:213 (-) Transcript_27618:352-990(-)